MALVNVVKMFIGIIIVLCLFSFCEASNCTCVHFSSCNTNNTYGAGWIDVRGLSDSPCPNFVDVCCNPEDVVPPSETNDIFDYNDDVNAFYQCGYNYTGKSAQTAALFFKPKNSSYFTYRCGVALFNKRAVLTAAHCLKDVSANYWVVKIGRQIRRVKEIISHPHFDQETLHNDLAILILSHDIVLSDDTGLICLILNIESPKPYTNCYSMGWSTARLPLYHYSVVPRRKCQVSLNQVENTFSLSPDAMCVSGRKNLEMCNGQGGGPLICPVSGQEGRYRLVGIALPKIDCSSDEVPLVFLDVSKHTGWIDEKMLDKDL